MSLLRLRKRIHKFLLRALHQPKAPSQPSRRRSDAERTVIQFPSRLRLIVDNTKGSFHG